MNIYYRAIFIFNFFMEIEIKQNRNKVYKIINSIFGGYFKMEN